MFSQKNRSTIFLIAAVALLSVVLSACQGIEITGDAEVIATAAAQTLAAEADSAVATQIAEEALSMAQTQTAQAALSTQTAVPTATPEPTRITYPTQNSADYGCNQAAFVDDITIEDRTVLEESSAFTKVWRLENTGSCAWDTDYKVVFSSGYQMQAPAGFELPQPVNPGETVDITVNMVAPGTPGIYTSYWMLLSDEGKVFGVGADNASPFWVRIRVTEDDEYVIYNLGENFCDAGWESSVTENIACPSDENLEEGFVQGFDSVRLEDGKTYVEPTILTYPDADRSGYMVGRFPDLVIEEGDHFRATIGCQYGAQTCNVNYTLRIVMTGQGLTTLGQWREVYDGLFYPIDVDLSDYAGKEIELVLSAITVDDSNENYALWLDPRVVRDAD